MRYPTRRLLAILLVLAVLAGPSSVRLAAADEEGGDYTPPRLSFVDGEVSFWRPGAADWVPAQANTPLAPGDELHTGYRGNLELQVHDQAFVRAWGDTHVGLTDQGPAILQLKLTAGHLILDVRRVEPGATVEVNAPHGALVLNGPGFYRVDVGPQRTAFTLRGGGRATLALASGATLTLGAGEQVVLDGATVQRLAAPAPDVWDTWNEARTVQLLAPASARYVPSGVAGVADLDRHGTWRMEPSYGAVWVPAGVPAGWAPYSTGRWIADPHYGWTWLDTAPWGWAPYHYGRWVYLGGVWAWAPGPIVVRPFYAPALVAFFGSPGVSVAVTTPFVSWVALGWGEPVVPWWRTSRFHGRPWWGGWGGPRIVNNVVVHRTTVIDARRITDYRNARIRRAMIGVREDSFGRRPVHEARLRDDDLRDRRPIHGGPHVRPDRASFVPTERRGVGPAEDTRTRPVVGRDRDRGDGFGDRRREPRRLEPPRAGVEPGQTPRAQTPRTDSPRAETPHVPTPRADAPRVAGPGDTPRPGGPAYGRDARGPGRVRPSPEPSPAPPAPDAADNRQVREQRERERVDQLDTPGRDGTRAETPRADAPRVEPRRPQPVGTIPPSRPADPPRAVPPERRVEPSRPRLEVPPREVGPAGARDSQSRAAAPAARREPGPARGESRGSSSGAVP